MLTLVLWDRLQPQLKGDVSHPTPTTLPQPLGISGSLRRASHTTSVLHSLATLQLLRAGLDDLLAEIALLSTPAVR